MMKMTDTVKQLLIINVIFYIGSNYVGDVAYNLFSMYYPENPNFRLWQPLTHMFMHAQVPNFTHILFNMFALYSFGSALEHFWGAKKFIFFYISCGLGAALLHTGVNYFQIHSLLNDVSTLNLSNTEIQTLLNADYRSLFDDKGQMIAGNVKSILERVQINQEQFNTLVDSHPGDHKLKVRVLDCSDADLELNLISDNTVNASYEFAKAMADMNLLYKIN